MNAMNGVQSSKGPVEREAHALCRRLPGGAADQCSQARRIAIRTGEWARKIREVIFRHGVAVIQIDEPGRGKEVGDADLRHAANQPAGAGEILGRAGLIH